jgi:16S rRNA (cytosine967-C5)-methyltransferase
MIAPARAAAYDILLAVALGRADLPTAIERARPALRDPRDRALAAEIATGVQRRRAALDHAIATLSRRPIDRFDAEVLEILRLSAYQLLHLSRVPPRAVVDDAVAMAGKAGKRSASGLVNAVLRTLSTTREPLFPSRPADASLRGASLDYLSITLSHPRWLAERWYDRMGLDRAEAWCRFNNEAAPLTLRSNTRTNSPSELSVRLEHEGVVVSPGRYAPDALVVERGQPLATSAAREGRFMVQDEASQLVALLAGDHPGRRVLDACAAPGGKATAIAATLDPGAALVACDVRRRRITLLSETIRTLGADKVRIVQASAEAGLPFGGVFDTVLVDAPCSGLGTLRRDPDIRWRRQASDLPSLAATQRQMLGHAASTVSPGGRLIYATCSTEPEENEAVVEGFLRDTRLFRPLDARLAHPRLPGTVVDARGHLRTTPDAHGLEGFFGAVFERSR